MMNVVFLCGETISKFAIVDNFTVSVDLKVDGSIISIIVKNKKANLLLKEKIGRTVGLKGQLINDKGILKVLTNRIVLIPDNNNQSYIDIGL